MGKYEDERYKRYFDFLGEVDKQSKNIDVVISKRQLNIAKEAEQVETDNETLYSEDLY